MNILKNMNEAKVTQQSHNILLIHSSNIYRFIRLYKWANNTISFIHGLVTKCRSEEKASAMIIEQKQ